MTRDNLRSDRRSASFRAAALLSGLLLTGCGLSEGLFAGGSSSTETGDKVSLSGRVRSGTGQGVAGVIVRLEGTTLADTTDLGGRYYLIGQRVRPSASASDVLVLTLNGQILEKHDLQQLTGSIPEVMIVQRGFSGFFSGLGDYVTRVEGVVTGDSIPVGDSIAATFFYNVLSHNYSGFIWFPPPTTNALHYTVHINIYGPGDVLIGRSLFVPFNSQAGNITIPEFDPNNLSY